jgi:hypothetical protein
MRGHEEYRTRLAAKAERSRVEHEARLTQIAREASGEARGFRYAIACEVGWLGPETNPRRLFADSCLCREPTIYEGDRESSQARARQHAEERNRSGGATHHSPEIVPEHLVAMRAKQRGWG